MVTRLARYPAADRTDTSGRPVGPVRTSRRSPLISSRVRPAGAALAASTAAGAIVVKWFFRLAFFLPCILPSAVIALI